MGRIKREKRYNKTIRVCIDPAKHQFAWAKFTDNKMIDCGLEYVKDINDFRYRQILADAYEVIVERPQIYKHDAVKRRNDLMDLAITMGRIWIFAEKWNVKEKEVTPHSWKGGVTKTVMTERIVKNMTEKEKEIMKARMERQGIRKGLWHNVYDAIGIGFVEVGRL